MARRNDIDWERVQRLYVAGQLTIRQIAEECGVSDSQVRARAKKEGWQRNLGEAIRQRAKSKIASIDVQALVEQSAHESAQKSAALIQEAIEQASDVAAGVIVRHRADIRLQQDRASRLEALFDSMIDKVPPTIKDVETGVEALNVGDVFKLSQTFKAIVESRSKLMDKEREAFGIEEGSAPGGLDDDVGGIEVVFVESGGVGED